MSESAQLLRVSISMGVLWWGVGGLGCKKKEHGFSPKAVFKCFFFLMLFQMHEPKIKLMSGFFSFSTLNKQLETGTSVFR